MGGKLQVKKERIKCLIILNLTGIETYRFLQRKKYGSGKKE